MGCSLQYWSTGALVNALKKLMVEEKISINTNSEVTKILTEDQKVIGVEINNSKRFFADKVVVNADPAFTYNNLLKNQNITENGISIEFKN